MLPVRALQQYPAVAGAEDAPVLVAWLQAPCTGSNSTDWFGAAGDRKEAGHLVAEEADEGRHVVVVGMEPAEERPIGDDVAELMAAEGDTAEVRRVRGQIDEDLREDVLRQR
jgi:hypothetical protein